jgi:hypothetical protein
VIFLPPEGPKVVAVVPTLSGYHLITERFDVLEFERVMSLYGPEKPSGENIVVCHRNPTGTDGKPDNRISNLYWCDRSKNVEDSWDDGLMEEGAKWKD